MQVPPPVNVNSREAETTEHEVVVEETTEYVGEPSPVLEAAAKVIGESDELTATTGFHVNVRLARANVIVVELDVVDR